MISDEFIDRLRAFEADQVFNPWSQACHIKEGGGRNAARVSDVRVRRLQSHFDCVPKFLLVGEAPGYRGCRYSGVPFTSERQVLSGLVPRVDCRERTTVDPFGADPRGMAEPSATIVWETLRRLNIAETTVMWNAFPCHPFEQGDPLTNRTPTRKELEQGRWFLQELVDGFCYLGGATMVAVGDKAELAIRAMGFDEFPKIRHPANGGAAKFRVQMQCLVDNDERAEMHASAAEAQP